MESSKLIIHREFNASISEVFNAFTSAEAMGSWWGPVGMRISVMEFDFRPSGRFHYKMSSEDREMWGLFRFQSIIENESIEFINCFSSEKGDIVKAPFDIDFPLEIMYKIIFLENNGGTLLKLEGQPMRATSDQETCYHSMLENMDKGFNGTFDQLDNYLSLNNTLTDGFIP